MFQIGRLRLGAHICTMLGRLLLGAMHLEWLFGSRHDVVSGAASKITKVTALPVFATQAVAAGIRRVLLAAADC
jgi:hypothetical protein